jgi:hypothetical protein
VVVILEKDISHILNSWNYESDSLVIRKIEGDDGKEKMQIRIKMGLLQMEVEGRPDGKTPHGLKSLLDFYKSMIQRHVSEPSGIKGDFMLTEEDMEELDEEIMQYYHRRICFFALGDYIHAKSDAEHNLGLMDIIRDHCDDKDYIESHEKYRPFVIMERARAAGLESIKKADYASAMKVVSDAIHTIEGIYAERGISEEEMKKSRELNILIKWRSQIHQDWEGGVSEVLDNGDDDEEYDDDDYLE